MGESEDRAMKHAPGQGAIVPINSRTVGRLTESTNTGDTVFIHGKVANKYENGEAGHLGSTVLHELIHWPGTNKAFGWKRRVGQEFEMEAYGDTSSSRQSGDVLALTPMNGWKEDSEHSEFELDERNEVT